MGNHSATFSETTEPEVPEDSTPTDPIITPDTPPTEVNPTDPAPTPEVDEEPEPEPEVDEESPAEEPVVDPEPEPTPEVDEEPPAEEEVPVEPSPEPPAEERPIPEGDKPIESLPLGSVPERAVTAVSKIDDPEVRALLMSALGDRKAFSQDMDLHYRTTVANCIREMNRWIRTNVPSSVTYKTFMESVNHYLLMVETQGIPTMWSAESSTAPLDEVQARKAAMAVERAAEYLALHEGSDLIEVLRTYAQNLRVGKI